MRLYFAGYSTDKEIFKIDEAEFLLESYLLFKNKDFVEWHRKRGLLGKKLFLDSGAFSAFTRNEVIDIDDYIGFIKLNKDYLEVYAGLDVIGDWQKSRKNQEYMEKNGITPLPTFHFGSPLDELDRMCQKYDYIALGGLVPLSMDRRRMKAWLDSCFSVIKKYWPKKIHGFGVNAFWAWERYPFYSVDATSWLMGGKFRRLVNFNGDKMTQTTKSKGVKGLDMYNCHTQNYMDLNGENVKQYLKMADHITKLWAKRCIKW